MSAVARTFGVRKFPTILFFDGAGLYYEFKGIRSLPRLRAFIDGASGARGAGMVVPPALQPDVSDLWQLAEVVWDPLKTALMWSIGIALALKGAAQGLLYLLERRSASSRQPSACEDEVDPSSSPSTGTRAAATGRRAKDE